MTIIFFIIHHSFTLSLQAQNLPFQQILPTLDFFYLPDCLHGTGPDLSCSSCYFLVSHFNFLFVPCGGLSWLPVSFLLHVKKYTRRAFDAPVNSRRPCVPGGRGSRVEQSAGQCHFVTIAVDIQETAEDRTVCSELPIAPAASGTLFFTARTSFRFFFFVL